MKNLRTCFNGTVFILLVFNMAHIISIQGSISSGHDFREIEYAASGIDWNCETHLVDIYYDPPAGYTCMACGMYHPNVWETYECDNGIFSWCYPGYIIHKNDCNGYVGSIENIYMSGCN